MEKFSDLIVQRRSHRKFTDIKPTEEQVKAIMRAALMAPTSKGTHSYEFVVVDDAETLQALSNSKDRGAEFLANAPLGIVVAADPAVSDVWVEDASVAATMMLLQAEDLGLGGCWIQIRKRNDEQGNNAEENVRKILNIPEQYGICCIVAIGNKGSERKPQNEEKLLWEKVHNGKF